MEWISVEEKLPEIPSRKKIGFVKILMTDGKDVIEGRFRYFHKSINVDDVISEPIFHTYCSNCLDGQLFNATHWMEIPELPKDI